MDTLGNWTKFYDNSGTSEDRTANAVNEYTAIGGTGQPHDANGNLTDDGTYEYEYDALNRLIKVTRKSDSAVLGEYSYDAQNRRVYRKADEDQSGSQETELYYVLDRNQVIEERVYSDEDLKRDYWYGVYIDEPVFARCDLNDDNDFADTDEQFYYLHNTQYSVHAIIDTSGSIIEVYKNYQPYGAVDVYTGDGGDSDWWDGDETTGSLSSNYYLFTGRRYDPEADLMFYRNRMYSTSRGRFLQRDPIGYVDGLNLYRAYFVLNYTDMSGLCLKCGPDISEWVVEEMSRLGQQSSGWFSNTGPGSAFSSASRQMAFANLVRTNGPWDHKQAILQAISNSESCPVGEECEKSVTINGICVQFEVVSNMIFGFAGRMGAFGESWLHRAAGAAQIREENETWASALLRTVGRENYGDEPEDSAAIDMGYDIYNATGGDANRITLSIISTAINSHIDDTKDVSNCSPCSEIATPTSNIVTGFVNHTVPTVDPIWTEEGLMNTNRRPWNYSNNE